MTRLLSYILALSLVVIFSSCKKDSAFVHQYLPTSYTISGQKMTVGYDSKNRVNSYSTYFMNYGSSGQLGSIDITSSNGKILLSYNGQGKLYHFSFGGSTRGPVYYYDQNGNDTLIVMVGGNWGGSSGVEYIHRKFDGNGNVVNATIEDSGSTYKPLHYTFEYDNHPSIFKNVGYPVNDFLTQFVPAINQLSGLFNPYASSSNNITAVNGKHFSISYNSGGYPSSITDSTGNGITGIQYDNHD